MPDPQEEARRLISQAGNIIAFTGAGISTSCGILDFRSPGGLYNLAKERYNLPYPEALFDLDYFRRDPRPFFNLSKELFLMDVRPSRCHRLLASLEQQGKLSLVVTQNIDMLHQKAGSRSVLECHGSYQQAHCLGCRKRYSLGEIEPAILEDQIPSCGCGGVIKPDVVFFGEALPEEFYRLLENLPPGDLVLILGTSLTVQPASLFALNLAAKMPSVLVNLEETDYDREMDVTLHEDLDRFARRILEGRP